MKTSTLKTAAAILFSAAPLCLASHSHNHQRMHQLEKYFPHHQHQRHDAPLPTSPLKKREGQCQFPTDDANLVAITPLGDNAGWAMSPDQVCEPGMFCPIACKPGMVSAQWDPDADTSYPLSMNGGLYCDDNGIVHKPFKSSPYCVEGTGAVKAVNKCNSPMSWCQTVYPGNEDVIIPTLVDDEVTIAVPDSSYFMSTSAHFYLNPPGSSESDCSWGDESTNLGNWATYVAGANTDSNGNTFVTLGSNPIWEGSSLSSVTPTFGLEIECPGGGCNGLPCRIDPRNGIGKITSDLTGTGAGNSDFCVVTVPKGGVAHIITFDLDGDDSDDEEPEPSPEPTPEPTTSEEPTTTPEPTPTTTSTPEPTTTPEPSTSTTPTSTSTSTTPEPTTKSTKTPKSTTKKARPTVKPGVFHENGTSTDTSYSRTTATTLTPPAITEEPQEAESESADDEDNENQAGRHSGNAHVAGLIVAFVAAACFF